VSSVEAPILADDSGRRRRRLRVLGRVLSGLLILWLGILGLGALGLQPLGGLPVLGLTPGRATPSELPARIRSAVRMHRVIAPSSSVRALLPADAPQAGARSSPPGVRGRSPRSRANPGGSGVVLRGTQSRPVGPATPGGSSPAPTTTTPVAPGRSGTTPAPTTPVPPGRSGTTPAPTTPGSPEPPGRSGTTPAPTTPAPPAHGAPADPKVSGTGPSVTTPAS
jgi:hypothetical protein